MEAVARPPGSLAGNEPFEIRQRRPFGLTAVFSLIFGMTLTFIVSGYQFGGGNHTVYLLDGMRELHPELLAHDWFVTQTLQYHALFSALTALLMRLNILQPAFLVGYIAIVVLWHVAWRNITLAIGGDDRIYRLSVVLFYLSAGGISIGVFQFLQDACFLPSNVANVAMLWGMYDWMRNRKVASGIWFGVAGLFHVNFAAMVIGLWTTMLVWQWWDQRRPLWRDRSLIIGTLIAFVPSLINLGMAVPDELRHGGTMPMRDFVELYVRFRHAHHFDPLHWSIGLWISFLWPIPLAIWKYFLAPSPGTPGEGRGEGGFERRVASNQNQNHPNPNPLPEYRARGPEKELGKFFAIIFALLVVAFLFAGVWFLNEPLVQLCLWRFSIYVKMVSCVGAAIFIVHRLPRRKLTVAYCIAAVLAVAAYCLFAADHSNLGGFVATMAWSHHLALIAVAGMLAVAAIDQLLPNPTLLRVLGSVGLPVLLSVGWPHLGVGMTPEPADPNYRAVCAWAKQNTPVDAIFLVPPQETDFRLYGERAIVVNYKHVPQLSGEIIKWRDRLCDVLGLKDLNALPHDYTKTMAALSDIYEHRSADELLAVAAKYNATFIVVNHPLDSRALTLAYHANENPFYAYSIRPSTTQP